jgi:hypothetical protein
VTARSADDLHVLYVAGLPRSGSTVLGYLLGRLPSLTFVGELAYFWRRFAEGELCSCGASLADCPFWSAVVGKAFGEMTCERARELNRLERQITRNLPVLGLAPVRWSTRWSERICVMLEERAQLYQSIAEIAGAQYIVDSGKGLTFGAIMARLDDIRFVTIHLVRDPRGVAYSWQKHVKSDSEPRDMPRSPAIKTSAFWVFNNLFIQFSLKRLSSAYSRVRYEDLLAHPDETICEISRASGLPELESWSAEQSQHITEHHLVAGNPGVRRNLGSDLRLKLDQEWRSRLPRRHQLVVIFVCGGLMAAYRYSLRKQRR